MPGQNAIVVTAAGGRQGYKIGAMLFNLVYYVSLRALRKSLANAGVLLRISVQQSDASCLSPSYAKVGFGNSDGVPVVEATYVDDEALVLSASTPAALLIAIKILLAELLRPSMLLDLLLTGQKTKLRPS